MQRPNPSINVDRQATHSRRRNAVGCRSSPGRAKWRWVVSSLRKSMAHIFGVAFAAFALPPALAAPCDSPEYRQFDFWLGTWEVRKPDGKLAGMNHIEREYGGCVIHERYTTERGYAGESLNVYDAGRKTWHQTWVDNQGTLLLLEGGMKDGSMVLEGQTEANGKITKHRIAWTPAADGSIRQHWESTNDKGQWSTAFDGRYTKK
jgi:hypothetical protein